ncbi:S-adenosylmethionine mitochondrial carrier protein-like isoform X2 [Apis laboriosa]|uniref:S-adenosylmethionine mitochondrial carrier protein isoform X3 n=1 Tax=Apis mellifera TaxID=7460 RepID=A0A7M7IKC4_APIME|nr:S-adenosylmethionine mitochondrial carrier protein isoform X3 [Apis dorsata]XP_016772340.1 S-adenosylmethionine mitochondrial carrier protein isoform X3 [Apis mellifera]XP_043790371.1 S-adenosylmethionine mitochondrial carrier protein-like isoform X2 [Apis laboriosa]|eukprot:XP_016772340.1 S-adenosylmethionine mitochondrial carrier protein isoform X3 [Apis mellifera]
MLQESKSTSSMSTKNFFLTSLISGALAGTICDFISFPLDTLKTRLQSQHGFLKSGGFKQLYKGLGPVMVGSAPSASLFFLTYESFKIVFEPQISEQYHSIIHMIAASVGEMMPLWEYFKFHWKKHMKRECTPLEGALCGSLSVAISASITTPLDVAKTRIMLSNMAIGKDEIKISVMLKKVYCNYGFRGLFAGFLPRVGGFTISGFIFFGVYEKVREICISNLPP